MSVAKPKLTPRSAEMIRLIDADRPDLGHVDKLHGYDREGQPITLGEWAWLFENRQYRFVSTTWWGGTPFVVSTIWLGTDHGWGAGPRPIIFETTIMGSFVFGHFDWMVRDTTEQAARERHAEAVALVQWEVDWLMGHRPDAPPTRAEADDVVLLRALGKMFRALEGEQ